MSIDLRVRVLATIADVPAAAWDACANPQSIAEAPPHNPFISHAFLSALEASGSATARTGWQPQHLLAETDDGAVLGAAPAYLKHFGRPKSLQDLDAGHQTVGLRRFTTGELEPLIFSVDGKMHNISLAAPFSVTGPESYLLATRLGLGLAQMPHFHVAEDLKRGSLVAVLTDSPPPSAPVSLMYAQNRQLSPRVRAFSNWLARQFRQGEE